MITTPTRTTAAFGILFGIACSIFSGDLQAQRPKLILDADTANEIDDMYAIARMLNQEKFEVIAVSSAQWIHYLAEENSVAASQRENEELIKLLAVDGLPLPLGSREPMGKPWGGYEAKDSSAAQAIIQAAREATPDNKLAVVCLGASTNLASAIKLAPEIAGNIDAYVLGFRYDLEKNVWNKSSFNIRRDLNAADFILNCQELELHVMPANVARALTFPRDETFVRHKKMGALGTHLTAKWNARFPEFENWVMWDLALVEAIIHPELATKRSVKTPPENLERTVNLYDSIKTQAMRDDYWSVVQGKYARSDKLPDSLADLTHAQLLERFQPFPEKVDMLVVIAHPDDEGYFGGLLPYYSVFRNKKVVLVALTSGEWGNGLPHHKDASEKPVYSFDGSDHPRFAKVPKDATYPCYYREEEMARAMLAYGVKFRPVMPRFKDMDMNVLKPWYKPGSCFEFWGGRGKVVGYIASQIRRFRPDVVVTLPVDGGNGNPQHCAASRGTVLAFDLAGKATRLPGESPDLVEPWSARKLYVVASEEELSSKKYSELHVHDWEIAEPSATSSASTGKTARMMAAKGNAQHVSQEMQEECDASSQFVLVESTVGKDERNENDLFENIKTAGQGK